MSATGIYFIDNVSDADTDKASPNGSERADTFFIGILVAGLSETPVS
jgi:hypothetical protein